MKGLFCIYIFCTFALSIMRDTSGKVATREARHRVSNTKKNNRDYGKDFL